MEKKHLIKVGTLVLLLGLSSACSNNQTNKEDRVIPYPAGYKLDEGGGSAYNNKGDHEDSKYYSSVDYYDMKSGGSLVILPKYKTYQQSTEVTCGPAAALTVLYHYGNKEWEELRIAEIMQTHKDLNGNNTEEIGVANEQGEYGTSTDKMVAFFKQIGWEVTSSLTADESGYTFQDTTKFKEWVVTNIKEGTPIMVEWMDWSGHWQVIIGYDDMGTPDHFGDDVLILADPYDTSDHNQDGYYTVPAERFFYMWQDKGILPEDQQYQQWLIAKPAK